MLDFKRENLFDLFNSREAINYIGSKGLFFNDLIVLQSFLRGISTIVIDSLETLDGVDLEDDSSPYYTIDKEDREKLYYPYFYKIY